MLRCRIKRSCLTATAPLLRVAPLVCAVTMSVAVNAAEPRQKSVKPSAATPAKTVVLTTRTIAPGPVFSQIDRTSDLLKPPSNNNVAPPNSCSANSSSLCYDYRTGRAVFKPTKRLLPAVPGLTPESITLKRDRLALNYSF